MCISNYLNIIIHLPKEQTHYFKQINISYLIFHADAPTVKLQLGSKLNPNDIEEGDDVYFECVVDSNPPAYKVVWEHDVSIIIEKLFVYTQYHTRYN